MLKKWWLSMVHSFKFPNPTETGRHAEPVYWKLGTVLDEKYGICSGFGGFFYSVNPGDFLLLPSKSGDHLRLKAKVLKVACAGRMGSCNFGERYLNITYQLLERIAVS